MVPVANGTEPLEAVITIDVLRRAGADVTVASVENHIRVDAAHQIKIVADSLISDCADTVFDLIALPVLIFLLRFCISMLWLCIAFVISRLVCFQELYDRKSDSLHFESPSNDIIRRLILLEVISVYWDYSYHCISIHHVRS